MHILLVCSAGFSTHVLVNRMMIAARKQELGVQIDALPAESLDRLMPEANVVLVAPQLKHVVAKIQDKVKPLGIPVSVIDATAFSSMDGGQVLAQALSLLEIDT